MSRRLMLGIFVIIFLISILPNRTYAESINVSVSAQAAVLMEQSSGRVLYGKREHEPLRIASITKIMTAILAIESGKMDDMVKVSSNAARTEGSSLYLRANEQIRLTDLVYGLMLRSGNDSAVAIAEHVGGSLDGFVYLMNEKAREIGMEHTVFSNPHGLDDHEEHYSSAYDMALLMQYAMTNEQFQKISRTKSHRVEQDGQLRVWKNKNRLLTQLYKYSTGGKTGFTKRANRTLVSTASKDGIELIAVTLNAPSDWHDHMNLFNQAFDMYKIETLLEEGILKKIHDDFYKNKVYAPYTFSYPLSEKEKEGLEKEITLYKPPTKEQMKNYQPPQPVGKVQFKINGETFAQVPLYMQMEKAPNKSKKNSSFWSRFKDTFFFTIGVKHRD
ncbi:D-alanyl-D-alanine carboxypeptidase family protein [Halalkalibacterium ligniniphilum]|uniref:D-alanyl-D-alanine carboxypeptidase family protein n=1 Tax=Halalkalibacterium ligniniphilum TaxID=1134413 RepID=UPI000349C317|nr:D-alanyl-D-alanine carboxypeptidase family protein [Halalkalibacterium ligniniphilum]